MRKEGILAGILLLINNKTMTPALLCSFMEEGNVLIPRADVQMWLDPAARKGFPGGSVVKMLSASAADIKRCRFELWLGRIPWRKAWQPTRLFLPGESPWAEEPGGLQSVKLQRVTHNEWLSTDTLTIIIHLLILGPILWSIECFSK